MSEGPTIIDVLFHGGPLDGTYKQVECVEPPEELTFARAPRPISAMFWNPERALAPFPYTYEEYRLLSNEECRRMKVVPVYLHKKRIYNYIWIDPNEPTDIPVRQVDAATKAKRDQSRVHRRT